MAKDLESIKSRVSESVTLGSILIKDSILGTTEVDQQVHCPFHGKDVKKSARYYADTDTMYCWVCKIKWDMYHYLMDKNGQTFKDVLDGLLKEYRIKIDDLPEMMEAAKQRIFESRTSTNNDLKKTCLEKMRGIIMELRGKIDIEKYRKFVYVYLALKTNTPDDKFEENFVKLKDAVYKARG